MTPLRTYEVFNAMKLHWTNSNYDFIKFRGKARSFNKINLDQSNDRGIYYKVAMDYKEEKDLVFTLIPLFLKNPDRHISILLGPERNRAIMMDWYRKIQRMPVSFSQDSEKVISYIQKQGMSFDQFFLGDPILDFLLYDEIEIESFIILDRLTCFLRRNKANNILYSQLYSFKVMKYGQFIQVDLDRYKKIFEKAIKKT